MRERLKNIIFVVPEGLSRLSEDRKINEKYAKNRLKIEAQDGAPLGIVFLRFLWILEALLAPKMALKSHKNLGQK